MAYLDQLPPEDREAFRIFADPTIDQLERERRMMALGQPAAPDMRLALNDGAGGTTGAPQSLPDVPPAAGVAAESAGGTTGLSAPSMGTEGAAPMAPAPPPQPAAATDIPVSLEEEPEAPAGRPGAGPARPQFDLPFASTGGRAVPTERVTEQVSSRLGTMSPDQRAEHSAALEVSEQAQNDLAALEADQQQRQREVDVQRREAEMAERDRLAQIRTEEIEKARRVSEQAARISDDLRNQDAVKEELWAGQNFGEKLVSFIGLLAMGAGLGQTGNAGQIVPTIQAMARREADRQKRYVELQQGALNALGTVYERHLQNYQNADLASKATQADIIAMAELELARQAKDAGPTVDQAKLVANAAALRTARLEAEAQRDKALGDQVETSVQRAFVRPMVQPRPAPAVSAAPGASATPRPQDFATPEEYFAALDSHQKAAAAPAPAAAGGARPAPPGAPAGMIPVSAREDGGGAPAPGQLVTEGRYREAIDRLPEKTRQGLEQQALRIKKELGDKATMADARVLAAQRFLGWPVPRGYVFQHARDRAVKDAGGGIVYAMGDNPLEVKKQLTAVNQLNSSFGLALRASAKPAAKWSPEERAALSTYANLTAPQIAVALGQGAMAEEEAKLYVPPAGGDVNGVADWIAGTGRAKVQAALQLFRDRRRVLLESFSRDPFDYVPVGTR